MMENINAEPQELHSRDMAKNARNVVKAMKAISHEVRLMLLWHLSKGGKTVSELANLLELEQSAISQQLARLRLEGIVEGSRQGRTILYRIKDQQAQNLIEIICSIYCASTVR